MATTDVDGIRELWLQRFDRPRPSKIICVGLNYRDHAAETGSPLPERPLLFGKFANTLCGPGEPIVLPPESSHVDAEAELGVVIGRQGRRIALDDALEHVEGYTAVNDVSARDLQSGDGQWLRGKGFDTFCPVLPTLVPTAELGDGRGLRIIQRLNGEALQDSTTDELIFGVPEIVAFASTVFTLEPGDLLLTGTPAGVGIARDPAIALADGDEVTIEIDGIGALTNPVVVER